MLPVLVGAGLGLVKGHMDRQQEKKDRKTQAEIQRWSPWTGMQGQNVKSTSMLGSAAQGAMGGAMVGQMMGPGAAAPATTAETGIEAGALGAGGTPMAPGSQFHTPYAAGAAPSAAQDYTSPWMGLGAQYKAPGQP